MILTEINPNLYAWVNEGDKSKTLSPKFDDKETANEWYECVIRPFLLEFNVTN